MGVFVVDQVRPPSIVYFITLSMVFGFSRPQPCCGLDQRADCIAPALFGSSDLTFHVRPPSVVRRRLEVPMRSIESRVQMCADCRFSWPKGGFIQLKCPEGCA